MTSARPSPTDAPVIVGALRTAIGTAGMAFRDVPAADLAAPVLSALAAPLDGLLPNDVVLGNCMGPGGDLARVAALRARHGIAEPGAELSLIHI